MRNPDHVNTHPNTGRYDDTELVKCTGSCQEFFSRPRIRRPNGRMVNWRERRCKECTKEAGEE